MKTQKQIIDRIYELKDEQHLSGQQLKQPISDAQKQLIQNEQFARNNQMIALHWVID